MKRKMAFILFSTILSLGFSACSSDNFNKNDGNQTATVNPSNVFTNKMPQSADGFLITRNNEGLITRMNGGSTIVTFDYNGLTRATTNMVKMTIDDGAYICNMELGKNGFVKQCTEIYDDGNIDTWTFSYNSNGQLNEMLRSEGGYETTTITYEGLNIIHTSCVSRDDGCSSSRDIYYTSSTVPSAIENKGCLMMFDLTLGIDMDEMWYAYYAGLLGKSTKNLPVRNEECNYNWVFNSDGYPIELNIEEYSSRYFTW